MFVHPVGTGHEDMPVKSCQACKPAHQAVDVFSDIISVKGKGAAFEQNEFLATWWEEWARRIQRSRAIPLNSHWPMKGTIVHRLGTTSLAASPKKFENDRQF